MSLEKLAMMQYKLTTEKKRLIEERYKEMSKCSISWWKVSEDPFVPDPMFKIMKATEGEREEALEIMSGFTDLRPEEGENCYNVIIRELKGSGVSIGDDYISFDEAIYTFGCEHCQRARTLKKEIGKIGTKIGQIRGQITRYGKRLSDVS